MKKKEKLHLDKTNCSVYVFNVLCSACFSMEWNIPKRWLVFTKWISNTRPKHMQHYTHTHTHTHYCTVRWNTLRKLKLCDFWWMDWWKMNKFTFSFVSIVSFIQKQNVPCPSSCPNIQTHTHTFTHTHLPLLCAVRGGGRWWQLTWDIQDGFIIVIISHPIISMDPSSSWFSAAAG